MHFPPLSFYFIVFKVGGGYYILEGQLKTGFIYDFKERLINFHAPGVFVLRAPTLFTLWKTRWRPIEGGIVVVVYYGAI